MKRLLSIIGAISLVGTSTTSLVACNTPQEYTKEQLAKLKEKNKINTTNQEIKDNLEWMASQEKPFKYMENNKYNLNWFFIIWRENEKEKWKLSRIKFKNNSYQDEVWHLFNDRWLKFNYDNYSYNFEIKKQGKHQDFIADMSDETLYLVNYSRDTNLGYQKKWEKKWEDDNGINNNGKYYPRYFKAVYHWNLNSDSSYLIINKECPNLILDNDGNIKVEGE